MGKHPLFKKELRKYETQKYQMSNSIDRQKRVINANILLTKERIEELVEDKAQM